MVRLNLRDGDFDTSGDRTDIDRFIDTVRASTLETDPFEHLIVDGAVQDDLLDALQAAYPDAAEMARVHDRMADARPTYSEQRFALSLPQPGDADLEGVAAPFRRLSGLLRAPAVIDTLIGRFRPTVTARTDDVAATAKIQAINIQVSIEVIYDRSGFSLAPHTDGFLKLVTGLIYLPEAGASEDLGTRIYAPIDPTARDLGNEFRSIHGMREVKCVPYRRNTMLLFARTDQSFHGVAPAPAGSERRLIQFSVLMRKR